MSAEIDLDAFSSKLAATVIEMIANEGYVYKSPRSYRDEAISLEQLSELQVLSVTSLKFHKKGNNNPDSIGNYYSYDTVRVEFLVFPNDSYQGIVHASLEGVMNRFFKKQVESPIPVAVSMDLASQERREKEAWERRRRESYGRYGY